MDIDNASILKAVRCLKWLAAVMLVLVSSLWLIPAQASDAGKTLMAKGIVEADDEQQSRRLKRKAPVFTQDTVSTQENSATQLRMIDGALLSLTQSSQLVIANYEFEPSSAAGVVNMSLLKGGLRTVTGALEQSGDNYRLNTPVATIGVRGTHYEARMVDADLHLAAWEGVIEVNVTVSGSAQSFSLGPQERFQFAIVRSDGTVEFLLQATFAFEDGHSSRIGNDQESLTINSLMFAEHQVAPIGLASNEIVSEPELALDPIDNDRFAAVWTPEYGEYSSRTGVVEFNQVEQFNLSSSVGEVSDFAMSMTIDFDTSTIPDGSVSFNDPQGEWFAAFNGQVMSQSLLLSVNFAAHNNQRVSGNIQGILIDQAYGILGSLSFAHIDSPDINVAGSFELRSQR